MVCHRIMYAEGMNAGQCLQLDTSSNCSDGQISFVNSLCVRTRTVGGRPLGLKDLPDYGS